MRKSIVTSPFSYAAELAPNAINTNLDFMGPAVSVERPAVDGQAVDRPAVDRPAAGAHDATPDETAPADETWAAVKRDLRAALGVLRVAIAATEGGSALLSEIRAKTVAARNPGMMTEQRLALQREVAALVDELQDLIATQAGFTGTTLVSGGAPDLSVRTDLSGGTLRVTARPLEPAILGLRPTDALSLETTSDAARVDGIVAAALETVARARAGFSANARKIDSRLQTIDRQHLAPDPALGRAINATLSRDAARLVAYQLQQQLALETRTIARGAAQKAQDAS